MTSTTDIINALGAETIQRLCDVKEFSIRAAKREGQFPASWFDQIDAACTAAGVPCPRGLFAFKRPEVVGDHPPAHGNATPAGQEGAAS
jgi:hypothetical protein